MKRTLLALLATSALIYSTASYAAMPMPPQQRAMSGATATAPADTSATLEDRFTQCIKNPNCSTQVRMQLIQEENDAMNLSFNSLHQSCADANFQNCFDPKSESLSKWHTAHDRLKQLMMSMTAYSLETQTPAAGATAPDKSESMWDKIRGWYEQME